MTRYATFLLLLVLFLLTGVPAGQAEAGDILIVDVQKVLLDSSTGKSLKVELEKELQGRGAKLESMKAQVDKLKADLHKQASLLPPEAMEKKVELVRDKERDMQRTFEDEQASARELQKRKVDELVKKIDEIVDALADELEAQFVLENDHRFVLYAGEGIDITSKVIAKLDSK